MTDSTRDTLQTALGSGFVLGRELGGGGMSRVFLVEETALNRRLVVKLLPADLAADLSLARFHREIALAARLQHPHIVPLLATGDANGQPWFTMPFVDGESLRERLARGGELPIGDAVRLLRELASALVYAHDKGIVHRDIKPENVLLTGGIALLADFGVAKALVEATTVGSRPVTAAGLAVGTPAYMSPEQVSADPLIDERSDLYSFGVLAYEMLAGAPPFRARTTQALLAAHIIEVPEPVAIKRPAVPQALAALVMRCLEKRPSDRPQDAREVIRELDAIAVPTPTQTPSPHDVKQVPRGRRAGLAI
ncbi:MAG: serine/threonine protein kinase, partial [Gemmatimonadaceae bacterium]|nr:serine/threonine protein kinase [Gemmatimonadaceae bacterium]